MLSNDITYVIYSNYIGLCAFVLLSSVIVCNITNRRQVVALETVTVVSQQKCQRHDSCVKTGRQERRRSPACWSFVREWERGVWGGSGVILQPAAIPRCLAVSPPARPLFVFETPSRHLAGARGAVSVVGQLLARPANLAGSAARSRRRARPG